MSENKNSLLNDPLNFSYPLPYDMLFNQVTINNNSNSNNGSSTSRKTSLKNSPEIIRVSGELTKEIDILGGTYKRYKKEMDKKFVTMIRKNGITYAEYHQKAPSGTFATFETDDLSGVSDNDIICIAKKQASYKSGLFRNYDLKDEKVFLEIQSRYDSYKKKYQLQLDKIKKQIDNINTALETYKKNNISTVITKLDSVKSDAKDIIIVNGKGNTQKLTKRINEIKENCEDYKNSITEVNFEEE